MTIIGADLIRALPGQIADTTLRNVLSFSAEEIIEFGRPVMRGTDLERQCKNFVSDAGFTKKFIGVSLLDSTRMTGNYPTTTTVNVMDKGRVWVALTTGLVINAGDNAYLNLATNNITNILTSNKLTIGRFQSPGTSNGLTGNSLFILELDPGFQV